MKKKMFLNMLITVVLNIFVINFTSCNSIESVECKDGNVAEVISGFKSNSTHKVEMIGTINNDTFKKIVKALNQDKTIKIYLDLSRTDGLKRMGTVGAKGILGITLPKTLYYVTGNSFRDCTELEYIKVASDNKSLVVKDNVIYDSVMKYLYCAAKNIKEISIPESVKTIQDYALDECIYIEDLVIPETVDFIGTNGNNMKMLKTLTLNGGGNNSSISRCFKKCESLEKVIIGENVKGITWSFDDCPKLKSIVTGDSVETLNQSFTRDNEVTNIELGKNVRYVFGCFLPSRDKDYNFEEHAPVIINIPANCEEFHWGRKLASLKIENPENFRYRTGLGDSFLKFPDDIANDGEKIAELLNFAASNNDTINILSVNSKEYIRLYKNINSVN